MTPKTSHATEINHAALTKRILWGAAIALIPIVTFLLKAGEPDPTWPHLWMLRPLVIVPLAGAAGGVFYYFVFYISNLNGWNKIWANSLSLVVYVIGLWLGIVLGLDGTYWN